MKYYTISYKYGGTKNVINLGDDIQSLAVVEMLKQLSVKENQIDYIVRSEMGIRNQKREKGIFIPATGGLAWNTYPAKHDLPINDFNLRILYFGTRIPDGMFDVLRHYDAFIASMKKYEPIGCRDVATRDFLRSLGIKAFFSKCVTIGFDERHPEIKGNKIFIIGIPGNLVETIISTIPDHLKARIQHLAQIVDFPRCGPMDDNDAKHTKRLAQERLDLLKREAMLVISSHIHVVMPCAAMGIPVIFYDKTDCSRSSVAKSILPEYKPDMFREYDWNHIRATNISEAKRELKLLFTYRLQQEEWKIGLKTERLSKSEFEKAAELIEKRCAEEGPKINYTQKIFSTDNMVSALLGEKKEEISKLNRTIVLFGAGDLGRRLLVILRRYGINPVCFCDNKISDEETAWHENLPVISFRKLTKYHKNSFIIISTYSFEDEIKKQLFNHNFNDELIIGCKGYYVQYSEYLPPPIVYGSDFL